MYMCDTGFTFPALVWSCFSHTFWSHFSFLCLHCWAGCVMEPAGGLQLCSKETQILCLEMSGLSPTLCTCYIIVMSLLAGMAKSDLFVCVCCYLANTLQVEIN